MGFLEYIESNVKSGRISEISDVAEEYFECGISALSEAQKALALCYASKIGLDDLDDIIASHSEVQRTVKGHAFEVVFDYAMSYNGIVCTEEGGDGDVDRIINGYTLQLKTPYVAGCADGIVSYKTHKTHGAKSENESMDYYHHVCDFADFLVGLVSYDPFKVMIIPREDLPRTHGSRDHIMSPMFLSLEDSPYINNFSLLGISSKPELPNDAFAPGENELLPKSASMLGIKSEYILRAIFIKSNFRIWDMNMRGFIREKTLISYINSYGINVYPTNVTGLARSDKCDLVLKKENGQYIRFQVKGLTWGGCRLQGNRTMIDCESQLSRGRVNDHPTQSRLYKTTDFDYLIVAVDPSYTNALCLETFGFHQYEWKFYCIPMSDIRKHPKYTSRVFSHQYIKYVDLAKYEITESWFDQWKKES